MKIKEEPQPSYWELSERLARGGKCCEKATPVHCVCRASMTCKTHGTVCVGSQMTNRGDAVVRLPAEV